MSVKVMAKVWDTDLAPNLRFVLLAYADSADHDGTNIWPGEGSLTAKTGYSRSQVARVTGDLKKLGVLVQVKRGQKGQRAQYEIDLSHHIFKGSQDATLSGAVSDAPVRPSPTPSVSQNDTQPEPFSVASDDFSVASDDFSVAPTRPLPSLPPVHSSHPSEVAEAATRDLLWEVLVVIFGEPATKSERGKLNKVRQMFAEADVGPGEVPDLVAAYMAKFTKPNSPAPQPVAMTIAQRIGELRHFIERGPIGSPNGSVDTLVADREKAEALARLEADYGKLGGST